MSAQMEQLIAQFENFRAKVRQAESRFAGVEDMQARIAEVQHAVTSPDGLVTVVAGANGTVTDIRLTAGATHLEAGQLAAKIMTTLRQAVAGAVRQQAAVVDDAFGDAFGTDVSAQVRQAQEEAFGAVAAEDPASQPQQSPPPPPASRPRSSRPRTSGDDDDYFDQGGILRR